MNNYVTESAIAKFKSLLDNKFGAFLRSREHGSLEITLESDYPKGDWIQVEFNPNILLDKLTFYRIETEDSIDYDIITDEFIIRKIV